MSKINESQVGYQRFFLACSKMLWCRLQDDRSLAEGLEWQGTAHNKVLTQPGLN